LGQAVRALAGHTNRRYRDGELSVGRRLPDVLRAGPLLRQASDQARPGARKWRSSELSEVVERTQTVAPSRYGPVERGTPGRCLAGRRKRGSATSWASPIALPRRPATRQQCSVRLASLARHRRSGGDSAKPGTACAAV